MRRVNVNVSQSILTEMIKLKHQRLILVLYKYKPCDDNDRQQLEAKAQYRYYKSV